MSKKINHCEKCGGEGMVWVPQPSSYIEPIGSWQDVRKTCNLCCGEKDPDVVRDRELAAFDPVI